MKPYASVCSKQAPTEILAAFKMLNATLKDHGFVRQEVSDDVLFVLFWGDEKEALPKTKAQVHDLSKCRSLKIAISTFPDKFRIQAVEGDKFVFFDIPKILDQSLRSRKAGASAS